MASDVKLKPGWLTRDVTRAVQRASEWEAAGAKTRNIKTTDNSAPNGSSNGSRKQQGDNDSSQ